MCVWENVSVRFTVRLQSRFTPSAFKSTPVLFPYKLFRLSVADLCLTDLFPVVRAGSAGHSKGGVASVESAASFLALIFGQPGLTTNVLASSDLATSIRAPSPASLQLRTVMETMTGDGASCDAADEVTFHSAACTQAKTAAATLLAVQMEG